MRSELKQVEKRISELLGELWVIASSYDQHLLMRMLTEIDPETGKEIPLSDSHAEDHSLRSLDFEANFVNRLDELYSSIVFLLDSSDLHKYLKLFQAKFAERCKDPTEITPKHIFGDAGDYPHSLLADLSRFLRPVIPGDAFDLTHPLIYLENILRSTNRIIYDSKHEIRRESDIYNAVKNVVTVVFPTTKNAGANFLKIAKTYKPDILVPEARAAVEYKYVDSSEDLKIMLEGILVDVKGYTGDEDYSHFYAVLYLKEPYFTELQVREMWNEFKFPMNWKYIYQVAGNSAPLRSKDGAGIRPEAQEHPRNADSHKIADAS